MGSEYSGSGRVRFGLGLYNTWVEPVGLMKFFLVIWLLIG